MTELSPAADSVRLAAVPVAAGYEPDARAERLGGGLLVQAVESGFEWLSIALLAAEVLVVGAAVFFRYVINNPIAGSEEVATLILVWLSFVGGAVATRRAAHLSVNLFVRLLPAPAQAWIAAATEWLTLSLLGVLVWQALQLAQRRSDEVSSGFGYNMALLPLPAALGAAGMIVFTLARLAAAPRGQVLSSLLVLAIAGTAVAATARQLGFDLTALPTLPLLLTLLAVLLIGNAPLYLALGLPSVLYLFVLGGPNLIMLPQIMIGGTNNFVLLAIPLFVFAGALMETGGISLRLVGLATALVGHVRGGLAQVCVVGEILFSGISGSTVADVTAMGSVLLPAMRQAGYKREDAVSIIGAASAMGILVPPALLMVILAAMANLSVTRLFMAGFLPAFVLAGALMALLAIQARRKQWPVARRASLAELRRAGRGAVIPMLMPVIIFGSIFSGAATVTESAALAVLYALFVGLVVYREFRVADLRRLLQDSSVMTAVSMWVVATSSLFTWLLARQRVPDAIASWLLSVSTAEWFFMVASIVLFILFGALLEGFPAAIILGPILYPIAGRLGFDLIHYSVVIVASVGIGMFLPPIGIGLYIATAMARTTMSQVMAPFVPYLAVLIVALILVGLVPWISLSVPELLLGK